MKQKPTTKELAMIAAQIYSTKPLNSSDHGGTFSIVVNQAYLLWEASRNHLESLERDESYSNETSLLFRRLLCPLKVGKHFLPRVTLEGNRREFIPFDQFLKMTVGLSRKEDRISCFRKFVTAALEEGVPIVEFPEGSEKNLKSTGEIMGYFREKGVYDWRSVLESFRNWRIHEQFGELTDALVNDCLKKGLERESRASG